ncbi:hypothetical protein [Streptomyces sp. NPDC051776]|uniref:hypothetical protein n=1 Tax=Streptomyces sp. NPDC051776 TaxID=3155414 RepID=UPI003437CBD6
MAWNITLRHTGGTQVRAHNIATATMLVLAVGGWGVAGSGAAYADNGPTQAGGKAKAAGKGPVHGKVKARAEGGSSTGAGVFQQNIAQSARQNNNCNSDTVEEEGEVSLTNSRVTGRCVTSDGSLTAYSRIHNGPAHAQGGSAGTDLAQQNTAQRGRQNNNCNNLDDSAITLDGGRVEGLCADQDRSFSKHVFVKGGGSSAHGGNATSVTLADVEQQNVAQVGRQNNNCNNFNESDITLTEGRVAAHCGNRDASFSKHTHLEGGGARTRGGSSGVGADLFQQNFAQEGRQNNNCHNPNGVSDLTVTGGGGAAFRCGNKDGSFSKHTWVKGGGARAEGGSSTTADVNQQNFSQEGRQNNNCHSPNRLVITVNDGGRMEGRCTDQDFSFSKHTHVKGAGARAEGGHTAADVDQQNVAQEGRQNNNCNNPNTNGDITVTGGRLTTRCGNEDFSFSKHTWVKGGGAQAKGGSSTGGAVDQQNTAQEGQQNNNCTNPNDSNFTVTEGRGTFRCANKDHSISKHAWVKSRGAHAEGGSGATVSQQNIAQEGRQNNKCNDQNAFSDINPSGGEGGRVDGRCGNNDGSFSKHTWVKGGGARAHGGDATADANQQNTAQEGRQNNNCNNPNADGDIEVVDGGRLESRCRNNDASFNHKTLIKAGGARTHGGNATATVAQQNTAQEGRQNNNCTAPTTSTP